jgi:hypothetical protein
MEVEGVFSCTGARADAESLVAAPTEQLSTDALHAPEAAQPDPEELPPAPQSSSAEPSAASLLEVGAPHRCPTFPARPRWSC